MNALIWWIKYFILTILILEFLKLKIQSNVKAALIGSVASAITYQILGVIVTGVVDKFALVALFTGSIAALMFSFLYLSFRLLLIKIIKIVRHNKGSW